MTQKQLIKFYIAEFGSILPAKMGGAIYKGEMFGSETSKRCRELRAEKILRSEGEGKFERYYLLKSENLPSSADFSPYKPLATTIAQNPTAKAFLAKWLNPLPQEKQKQLKF